MSEDRCELLCLDLQVAERLRKKRLVPEQADLAAGNTCAPAARARLERRTRLLAGGGISWHIVEFAIAIAAGLAAGSIALIGFGADSLIEALAGGVVLWLFTGKRRGSSSAERRAQQLIAF